MWNRPVLLLLLPALLALLSCGKQGPHIDYGKAECAHCRMNVMDQRFGSVLVTKGGRQYVFDGPECMVPFVAKGAVAEAQVDAWYVSDFAHPGALIDATKAYYANGPAFRSPMRGDVAAFGTAADRDAAIARDGGDSMDWTSAKTFLQQ